MPLCVCVCQVRPPLLAACARARAARTRRRMHVATFNMCRSCCCPSARSCAVCWSALAANCKHGGAKHCIRGTGAALPRALLLTRRHAAFSQSVVLSNPPASCTALRTAQKGLQPAMHPLSTSPPGVSATTTRLQTLLRWAAVFPLPQAGDGQEFGCTIIQLRAPRPVRPLVSSARETAAPPGAFHASRLP